MGTMHFFNNKKDYEYIDKNVYEMFSVGSARLHIYKYLGPKATYSDDLTINSDTDANEGTIGDLLLGANTNRKYSTNVYEIWGHTQLSENSFNLMQFGIALSGSDTLYTTFHYNNMIKTIGRKIMSGDVIEMTFLKDYDLLDENAGPYSRFYVVQDTDRPSEGYSMTWKSHLWRVRSTLITDSPEFADIFGDKNDDANPNKDLSIYNKQLEIMDIILQQAENEVPYIGNDTHHLYVDPNLVQDKIDDMVCDRDNKSTLLGNDAIPPNMNYEDIDKGEVFPQNPTENQYFIRTDSAEERLFIFYSGVWRLLENNKRHKWSDTPEYLDIVNNEETFINQEGKETDVRQGLSKVVKPKKSFKS